MNELPYSLRELGERADDRTGRFYLLQHEEDTAPAAGRWEAGMGGRQYHQPDTTGHGDTPAAAVRDLIRKQEQQGR